MNKNVYLWNSNLLFNQEDVVMWSFIMFGLGERYVICF